VVRLVFLGTSGYVDVPEKGCRCKQCKEARAGGRSLRKYSSLALFHRRWKIFDITEQTLPRAFSLTTEPVAIFGTHKHPDHWMETDLIKSWFPGALVLFKKGYQWTDAEVIPFKVTHSKKAPAVGFKFICPELSLVYAPDALAFRYEEVFPVDVAILDGSSLERDLVRRHKETGEPIGHKSMKSWIKVCERFGINLVIFTHIGHVKLAHKDLEQKVQSFAQTVDVRVAYDGMEVTVK